MHINPDIVMYAINNFVNKPLPPNGFTWTCIAETLFFKLRRDNGKKIFLMSDASMSR